MFEANVATTQRFFEEVWGGGKFDLVDELCTEGYVSHDPVAGDADREGEKRSAAGYRGAFPDLTITIEEIFAAGDKVVCRWRAEGTFENEIMGQQPTHERGEPVRGIGIDRYEDGLIAESWTQWDTLQFMRNIGAVSTEAATA